MTEERKPIEVKAKAHQVKKSFKVGESVRVIQGNRSGESGIITSLLKNSDGIESHAVVTMIDDTKHSDLTILINNLRLKLEVDPNTQAALSSQVQQRNQSQITYQAGEIVMYDNHKKLGLII